MSDLRTRIVAVQADHVEGQLTNYDDDGREECGCGHQGNATYREHLADAVIAVVSDEYINSRGMFHELDRCLGCEECNE